MPTRGESDTDGGYKRVAIACLVVGLAATACRAPFPMSGGSWIGDVQQAQSVGRLEVVIDSAGRSAQLSLPSWRLDSVRVWRSVSAADSLEFSAVIEKDTVRLHGSVDGGRWVGTLSRGSDTGSFDLRRLYALGDTEWQSLVGSYRSADGRLLGIAPFSEFGTRPMIVDYATGRIGPLYPISRDRLLVGRALIAPVHPADSVEVLFGRGGEVEGIRVSQQGQSVTLASRLGTRDEDVRFTSGPISLDGTLTLPAGPPPYPALVLVHGSNAQTRDAFGPWSRFVAGQGFAVLSYDKRGTGRSTGDWKMADFSVLAEDVLASVRFLAARSDIRPDRIGLWGISQGGWILPIVAAQAPQEIAFLVVHAGSGTTVREEGVLYLRNELRAAGLPEPSVDIGIRYQLMDDSVTKSGSGWSALQRYYEDHRTEEPWLWPPRPAYDWFRAYYRMLMDFDPAPYWQRVTCPALFFFGELDANVPPAESWPPIEQALRQADNGRVSQILLPKADHVFLEAVTGGRDEYPGLSRFVPGYFSFMADWLTTHAR